jgi:Zn-dependent protease with chaperone function
MNFFESQQNARTNTTRLVVLFVLAVICLIVLTNILVAVTMGVIQPAQLNSLGNGQGWQNNLDWQTFMLISAAVITVVTVSSLYKMAALSGGGASVAEMMSAELVVNDSGDINKQKILNVVEEMAIASGTPVPAVYLIDEEGINAFAAGYKPGDAIIGITRGAIETLSREQLQGVIAHEFSHIFNGDMRLNIRLIGILHGILVIGMIGYFILRSAAYGGRVRVRSSKNDNGGGIIFLGIGLIIIGYAGTFFGNLIKAAVSRQREYLADASAVQFTRNPDGIAGALKQIGASSAGSLIENPSAAEISHTFFSQGVTTFLSGLFATHPPLEARIRAIEPNWNGEFVVRTGKKPAAEQKPETTQPSQKEKLAGIFTTAAVLDHIGNPQAAHLQYAQNLLAEIPSVIKQSAHEPHGARALIYVLLIGGDASIREKQMTYLGTHADPGVYSECVKLSQWMSSVSDNKRLPLIDMCIPTLRQLSDKQYALFMDNLDALIKMDAKISLFEWSLQRILKHHLEPQFSNNSRPPNAKLVISQTLPECETVLSFLIHACEQKNMSEAEVFTLAQSSLGTNDLQLQDRGTLSLDKLDAAIHKLNQLKPLQKPALLNACAAAISADKVITATEHELLRAIADSLDCPMPPLLV